jgi:tetratricopeptide (TPR) repeat protein
MHKATARTLVILLVLGLAASTAAASTQARVAGTITDGEGAPVTNAVITVTSPDSPAYNKVLETDKKGQFRILLLDATKTYVFRVEAAGYLSVDQQVKVPAGTMDNHVTWPLQTIAEARAEEEEEIRQQPGFKEYEEGTALLVEGKSAEARAKFAEAVQAVPDLVPAWRKMAEIDFDNGDFKNALASAQSCLEYDDEHTSCLAIAANSAKELGDDDAHAAYMQRYQELNPDDPATLFNQAVEFLNALDDEKAGPLLEQCLEVDDAFGPCVYEYGMLLLRSGDLEGAKAQLLRYLEVEPEGANAETVRETVKYL